MLERTWRHTRARAWVWGALTVMLPGWAYAATVYCPNSTPPDGPGASGTCLGSDKTGCDNGTPNGELKCPNYVNTNPQSWTQKCKYAAGACGLFTGYACEYYYTMYKNYADYGCVT